MMRRLLSECVLLLTCRHRARARHFRLMRRQLAAAAGLTCSPAAASPDSSGVGGGSLEASIHQDCVAAAGGSSSGNGVPCRHASALHALKARRAAEGRRHFCSGGSGGRA